MKRLLILAWDFLWIPTVTLGGGMAMIPFMVREFVERRAWLSSDEMNDAIAVTQSLPGLIAVNMAVLIGYRVKGVVGAVVAALASCITPFVVIAVIACWMSSLPPSPALDHIFLGVRAGTAALVLDSLLKLSKSAMRGALSWFLGAAGFVAAVILSVDITWIVLGGILAGACYIISDVIVRRRQ